MPATDRSRSKLVFNGLRREITPEHFRARHRFPNIAIQNGQRAMKNRTKRRSSVSTLSALRKARNEALRESFRLGGAMNDLQRASDDLQSTMVDLDRAVWKTSPKV